MEQNQFNQQSEYQNKNQTKNKKAMLSIVVIAIIVIGLVGVTFAFFNYTRTGSTNTIRTGRIAFNSTQGQAINLTNMFPIDVTNGVPNDATKVGSVTINVTGDTTYDDGLEYLVSAVNVQNTVGSGANAKALPISIEVSVASNTGNDPATTLGTADDSYFNNRGGNASIHKVLAEDVIENNDKLVVGYITKGATGVDGNIVIKAYLDASKIAITDTYPERTVHTVKTTGYSSSDCETALTGVTGASTYCASASALQSAIDNEDLTSAQVTLLVNAGIVEEYTDGTTSTWVGDRTRFTTSEWNSLQQNGVSFQVKVESNEGTWVTAPIPTIPSCPGCKFMYTTSSYSYGSNGTLIEDIEETIYDDYNDAVTPSKTFTGIIEENGKIGRAFACGIFTKEIGVDIPFCLEASTDGSTFLSNKNLLESLYEPYLYDSQNGAILKGCGLAGDNSIYCEDYRMETANDYFVMNDINGTVYLNTTSHDFYACSDGTFNCN